MRALAMCACSGAVALAGCGSSVMLPTSPERLTLTPGPYKLMAQVASSQKTPCTLTGPIQPTFQVFARLTMTREGNEWVARSVAGEGDIELRIHEVTSADPFQLLVSGTVRGFAFDKNTLGGRSPGWTMSFAGPAGSSAAQISGKHSASVELSFGNESFVGTATMTDGLGNTAVCTSLWEWSIQPGS